MKKNYLIILLAVLTARSFSQEAGQVLRGRVINAASGKAIANAVITVSGSEIFKALTDSSGYYEKRVPFGNYTVTITAEGFKAQQRSNIAIHAGKQQVYDVELQEFTVHLDSVVVAGGPEREGVPLELWSIQRFASAFYDPARVATSHAALVNTDDQANNLTIHGTSPNYLQWKVEGVEIVNPNHNENAGTINDRPSLNGGGVSLFSAQLLQNSGFQLSPFEPTGGNVLSGIFDMRLRNGNNEKHERIIQASLLGIDLSMEGPLTNKKNSSFLFNYRYSTVGLLSQLGVSFGGEKINFQDLAFIIAFPHKKGQLKLFSINGSNSTVFTGTRDSSKIETQKDLLDIDYRSRTTVNGISYLHSLSNTMLIKSIVSYSLKSIKRYERPSGFSFLVLPEESDAYRQEKISTLTYISKRIDQRLRIKGGFYYNYFISSLNSSTNNVIDRAGKIVDPVIQPFVSFEGNILKKMEFRIGLHSLYQFRVSDLTLQPRAHLQYTFTEKQDVSLSYGRNSQLQPFFLYIGHVANHRLKPTLSNSFSFIHHLKALSLDFKSELYLQYFERIPVNATHHFSAFNYFNESVLFPLEQTGTAQVYGYDLTVQKKTNRYYVILSSSIYSAVYTINNMTYNGRFNTNYNCSFTAGRQYRLKTNRTLETDVRAFIRDGYRQTKAEDDFFYTGQLPVYYRIDLRICYKKEKEYSTVIWAIDIQNVTNRQNMSYYYYDAFTKQMESRYQLGLIPVLSYKILF
jgi:hypothetical protein